MLVPLQRGTAILLCYSIHQTFVKFSLAGEGVAATKSMTREWNTRGKAESRKKKVEIAKSRAVVLSTPSASLFIAFVSLRHSFGNINVPSSQGLCKRVQSKFTCCCKRAQPRLAKSSAKLRYRFAVPLRRGTTIFIFN